MILKSKDVVEKVKKLKLMVFDFDGVFTDNRVITDENGVESVICCRSDTLRLREVEDVGIRLFVISTETNAVVEARCKKMKIECAQGYKDKHSALSEIAGFSKLSYSDMGYMGNDVNDLECMKAVGLSVAPNDAHIDVLRMNPDLVTHKNGGYGAVRELCDFILDIRRK